MKPSQFLPRFLLTALAVASVVNGHPKKGQKSHPHEVGINHKPKEDPALAIKPLPLKDITVNNVQLKVNTSAPVADGPGLKNTKRALEDRAVTATTVSSTILVIARDAASANSGFSGLKAYGIPYETLIVPMGGTPLPTLNSSPTAGNFGGIVIVAEVSYDFGGTLGYQSALTNDQWNAIYAYQLSFGVRLVRIDVYPSASTGTTALGGCCGDGVEQTMQLTSTAKFPTSGLKTGATMSTVGLWHYPASVTDATIATSFATLGASGSFAAGATVGVTNDIGGRQQMVFFIGFATDWSPTSNWLQHAWINYITRGLYTGYKRVNLVTQIDDMFLNSDIYKPTGTTFKIRTSDLSAHKSWTTTINNKMSPGSLYFVEIGHNGNGNIIAAENANNAGTKCGIGAIDLGDAAWHDTPLEFQKPLGTGTNLWPSTPATYPYTTACLNLDPLKVWFATPSNRDVFAHLSHTFTHEAQNNATYFDIKQEITWNQAWLTQSGIAAATKFSSQGIIPPAITGLHNGDALQAWADAGITNCVGDNSRAPLRNTQSEHWALITNVADNGYAGIQVTPRWPTNIYYNCDLPDCTTQEWIDFSAGWGTFADLLNYEKGVTSRYLYGLRHDGYMFHQANLRQADVPNVTINGVSAKLSIFQAWVETIVQEIVRTTSWPIRTLKHDDLSQAFADRKTRDDCAPKATYIVNPTTSKITGITVSANGNTCGKPIPVTVPGTVTSTAGATQEKFGSDPLTLWTPLGGATKTYTLTTPIDL
ncbi:hypothetical protein BJ875DRAFT_382932 [Amylocarpus encephaloides]|uniref:Extracellular serine-rich protein n=1 Tax=Amylocarpus encephaloides TaxID=45428 RepID=A0A9P7YDZ3_9HELO|nr:hypothetical protein BJ875DRAFT_382932 [Amylocarpus encephaloides]